MTSIEDARGVTVVSNTYDADGRVADQELGNGGHYLFDYTTSGDRITRTDLTDPEGHQRRVTFDANGHVATDTVGFGTPQAQTTTLTADADGLLLAEVDPLGRRTELGYDPETSLPTSMTTLAGTPRAATWSVTYDAEDRISTMTDPQDRQTTYTYGASGALASVEEPDGALTEMTTDPRGRLLDGHPAHRREDGARLVARRPGEHDRPAGPHHDVRRGRGRADARRDRPARRGLPPPLRRCRPGRADRRPARRRGGLRVRRGRQPALAHRREGRRHPLQLGRARQPHGADRPARQDRHRHLRPERQPGPPDPPDGCGQPLHLGRAGPADQAGLRRPDGHPCLRQGRPARPASPAPAGTSPGPTTPSAWPARPGRGRRWPTPTTTWAAAGRCR